MMMTPTPVQTILDPAEYWKHCAQEWTNVAVALHDSGDTEHMEGFYAELADNADYMGRVFGYDWNQGR